MLFKIETQNISFMPQKQLLDFPHMMKILGILCISMGSLTAMAASSAQSTCKEKIETVIVNGDSMLPLLKNQQEVSLDLNYYSCHEIQKSDVIVFEVQGRKNRIVKKVYGVPGDKFEYKNNFLSVNGQRLHNSAGKDFKISSKMLELYANSYPTLPKDSYLVLGDQPGGSFDASRMGLIDRKQILGKVKLAP